MKNIYVFILITVFSSTIFGQTIPSYVPTNGLVGWWPFNGNANDESGNGNNGTVNGATLTADRFGNANKAYDFNITSANITTPLLGPTGRKSRSISLWFYTNSTNNSNDQWVLFSYGNNNAFGNFSLSHWNVPNEGIGVDIGSSYIVYNATFKGSWNNIILTYDSIYGPTVANVKAYLNGQILTNIKDHTAYFNINTGNSNLHPFGFGPSLSPIQSLQTFKGKIDDIGIWNRALTQQEITALYTANGVGIKDPSQNTLSVYPNPAKTQITLNTTTNQIGKTLKVYDALGKVVYETILKQQQYNINIAHWANGIYTVAIPEQNLTYKFVKE